MRLDPPTLLYFFALLVLLAAVVLAVPYYRSLKQLRKTLRSLAHDEVPRVALGPGPSILAEISRDLSAVAARIHVHQRQLAHEEFSLKTILGSMKEGVLITDPTLRVRLANDAAGRLLSLSHPPLGRTILEITQNHQLHRVIQATFASETPQDIELTIQRGGAEPRIALVHASPIGTNSTSEAVVVVFQDITELRKLEKVRKDFVANVSHEFRTPLSIIHGYIETLKDDPQGDPQLLQQALHVMEKHSSRLHLLIDDLLQISALENDKAEVSTTQVCVKDAFDRVVEDLDAKISEAGARIRQILPEEAVHVKADAHQLDQVLGNLLMNAIQHRSERPLEIDLQATQTDHEVLIAVTDNGRGIPLPDQPHLFERFYKVDKSRSGGPGGTGLGLSIVKHIVSVHGGRVDVQSIHGKGSTFRIYLPRAHPAGKA